MAKTSTTTVTMSVTGDGVSLSYTPLGAPIVNAAAPAGGPVAIALAAGDNTITVPPGAVGFILVPPAASVVVKRLKGIAADTGFTLAPATPSVIALPTAAASVLLNASATETVSIQWI
jgi:hypothetical protein